MCIAMKASSEWHRCTPTAPLGNEIADRHRGAARRECGCMGVSVTGSGRTRADMWLRYTRGWGGRSCMDTKPQLVAVDHVACGVTEYRSETIRGSRRPIGSDESRTETPIGHRRPIGLEESRNETPTGRIQLVAGDHLGFRVERRYIQWAACDHLDGRV